MDITVLLTGGAHQCLHLLPVVPHLRARGAQVRVLALDPEVEAFAATQFAGSADDLRIGLLRPSAVQRGLQALRILRKSKKLTLLANLPQLRAADAVVVAERTSSILRRWLPARAMMIHIPHGAGDRRVGFDPRARRYDFHIVSGDKDRRRFIAEGLAAPEQVVSAGSIKLAFAMGQPAQPLPPFAASRPVVLYVPHFDPALSSFHRIGFALIEAIAATGAYNLIVAPHVRLRSFLTPADIRRLEACRGPSLHVDLGSSRSYDMSYTRAADIYLGDVSSQVYEFLVRPRPCVFLNTMHAATDGDPDYRMWATGEVATDVPGAIAALERAFARHETFRAIQEEYFRDAMGAAWPEAPRIAAERIMDRLGCQQDRRAG